MAFDSWNQVVEEKISELELIASWASQTNYGEVRDYCRRAIADLKEREKIRLQNGDTPAQTKKLEGLR